jgi:hypothetical protein
MKDLPPFEQECFFIAPIGDEGSPERNRSDGVLEFIVERAAAELGLTAVRSDQISEPGQITVQVIDHILHARGAVADLTTLNPNVFYELAIRHTARLPIALIADQDCKLPFDVGQMRTIFFAHTDLRSADHCRQEIVAHLQQALDKGVSDSPVATAIDLSSLQRGTSVERGIGEVLTAVDQVFRVQRTLLTRFEQLELREPVAETEALVLDVAQEARRLIQVAIDRQEPVPTALLGTLRDLGRVLETQSSRIQLRNRTRHAILPIDAPELPAVAISDVPKEATEDVLAEREHD